MHLAAFKATPLLGPYFLYDFVHFCNAAYLTKYKILFQSAKIG